MSNAVTSRAGHHRRPTACLPRCRRGRATGPQRRTAHGEPSSSAVARSSRYADGRELVHTRLAGTFLGSPVELTFWFTPRGDLIRELVAG
jgi:hypothetical protein